MKQHSFFEGSTIFYLLTGIILTLLLISGCLYHQKKAFQQQNRELIIQNDSIIAVNIKLQNALQLKSVTFSNNSLLNQNKKDK